jgi:hypothetical protein
MSDSTKVEAPARPSLALCAPFRNEARFLLEWISHHRRLGVSRFFLYDNLSTDEPAEVLAPLVADGTVELVEWRVDAVGEEQWIEMHRDIVEDGLVRARGEFQWLAVIDVDEFLVPVRAESIPSMLVDYEQFGGLAVSSVTFGTSGVERVPDGRLRETLVRRGPLDHRSNRYVKTIAQPDKVLACPTSHAFVYRDGYHAVNSNGHRVDGIQGPICLDRVRLHHYWSRDESFFFETKVPRHVGWGGTFSELVAKRDELNVVVDRSAVPGKHDADQVRPSSEVGRSPRRSVGDRVRYFIAGGMELHADAIRSEISDLRAAVDRVEQLAAAQRDELTWVRSRLTELRTSAEYAAAWSEREPLVSVRIATWNRAERLVDVAIASALRQTYENIEVVVVGDGCTDDTESRIEKLDDPRVRFRNLPFRSVYPDDLMQRWLVAGSPCMNAATQMARGSWVAPLDDDDEFTDDHVEVLLGEALGGRSEFVYGCVERAPGDVTVGPIGTYPPQFAGITLQGALYLRTLGFFELDTKSWLVGEPGDWNLVRRMMEAGVSIGFTERVVARLRPSISGHDAPS